MKIGLATPNSDYGQRTADMALEAEQRGYDSLWVGEHSHIPASRETTAPGRHRAVLHPDLQLMGEPHRSALRAAARIRARQLRPPQPHRAHPSLHAYLRWRNANKRYWHMRDPFTSLGAAAAVTSRIKLVTGVCLVLEHEVLDLAKSVATLDEVSDGRFLFGVGVGWNREELANVSPVPWSQRYGAMRETIEALRGQWSQHEAGYSGTHVHIEPSWVYPKPVQQPGPPVLMGCQGRIGLQHAAEYADGWCPLDDFLGDARKSVDRFRAAVESSGRDPDHVPISMYCFSRPAEEKLELYQELGVERTVFGAPDEADKHQRFVDRNQHLVDTFAN